MLKLSETMDEIKVVDDQIGSPTYTIDLTEKVHKLIITEKYGTYHISNEGQCSWYEFACEIFHLASKRVIVVPCNTKDFPQIAKRPYYSVMEKFPLN